MASYPQRPYQRSQAPAHQAGRGGAPASPSPKAPAFSVTAIVPVERGNLRCFASVKIGPLVLHKVRLIDTQDGRAPWVSPPQETYEDKQTGETRYKPLAEIPREWKQPLTDCVVAAWEAYQREGGQPQ